MPTIKNKHTGAPSPVTDEELAKMQEDENFGYHYDVIAEPAPAPAPPELSKTTTTTTKSTTSGGDTSGKTN